MRISFKSSFKQSYDGFLAFLEKYQNLRHLIVRLTDFFINLQTGLYVTPSIHPIFFLHI